MTSKNILFILVSFAICLPLCGQKKDNNIVIGKIDSIYSHILKENRSIWIYLPKKASSRSSAKFPVLYLLDADQNFHSVTGIVHQLSEAIGNNTIPQMIVVGIINTDRVRDFTPSGAKKDIPFFKNSGGGAQFITFLKKELIPYIEQKYPAASYRAIAGHSLGGLAAVNMLLEAPEVFNSYIAIDPTITWDNQMILKKAEKLATKKLGTEKLYLAIANTAPYGTDTMAAKMDSTVLTYHVRSILKLTDLLKKDTLSGLKWQYSYYSDDSHISVPLISIYDGLRYIFDYYRPPSFNSILALKRPVNLDSLLTAHYSNVSKNLGFQVSPDEFEINVMAQNFLEFKDYNKAYSCLKFNIDNNPKSYNALNSMGDYYYALERFLKAKEYYSKAMRLKDNKYSREKLEELFKIQ